MQRSLDEIRSEMFDNQERKQAIMAQAERQNRDLTPEEAEGVLEQFYQMSLAHDYVIKGGVEYARKVLVAAFGPEQAQRMLDVFQEMHGRPAATTEELEEWCSSPAGKAALSEHHDEQGKIDPRQ